MPTKPPRRSKSADFDWSQDLDDDDPGCKSAPGTNGWKTVAPVPQKHKAHPLTTNGYWENDHAHTTSLRKSQQEKDRDGRNNGNRTPVSPPRRVKSMPVTRKKDRKEQMLTQLSDWKTQEFSEETEGPGMRDGRQVEKIGNEKELVGWLKPKRDNCGNEEDIASTEPFIGINRKPKATKLKEKSYKEVQGMGNRNRQLPS